MNSAYLLGVAAAIAAGIAIDVGMVFQKVAVARIGQNASLVRQMLRSPLWLSGFAVQFIVGTPLNMLAQANIGPAILPGLMSTGLIVLAIGAVWMAHESFNWSDALGILMVIAATWLFVFSRLGVDMKNVVFFDPALLLRIGIYTAAVAAVSVLLHLLQLRFARPRWFLRSINAGLYFVQSNLWLGLLMGLFAQWGNGKFSGELLAGVGVACAITAAGSLLGITETQRAFQCGDATRVVPILTAPQQILSLAIYFLVFNLNTPSATSLPLAGAGVVLLLAGSVLLARRQAYLSGAVQKTSPKTTGGEA